MPRRAPARAVLVALGAARALAAPAPLAAAAAALVCALPRVAHAQRAASPATAPARVAVLRPVCERLPFELEPFLAALPAQLATYGVDRVDIVPAEAADAPAAVADRSLATIALQLDPCDAGASAVTIAIDDRATRKSVRAVISLADVSRADRARTLALAAADLLRASWAELTLPDAPAPAAAVPLATVRAVAAPARANATAALVATRGRAARARPQLAREAASDALARTRRLRLGGALEGRGFVGTGSLFFGGRAFAALRLAPRLPLHLRVDGGAAVGLASGAYGSVDLGLATGAVALLVGVGSAVVTVEFGPRVEAGWTWANARPVNMPGANTSAGDPVLFVTGVAGLDIRLGSRAAVSIELEGGAAAVGFEALITQRDGSEVRVGTSGAVLGARLGVAVLP